MKKIIAMVVGVGLIIGGLVASAATISILGEMPMECIWLIIAGFMVMGTLCVIELIDGGKK